MIPLLTHVIFHDTVPLISGLGSLATVPCVQVILACRDTARGEETAKQLEQHGKECIFVIKGVWHEAFKLCFSELGTSLFEIAQSLFALEQTCILGAMAHDEKR